MFHFFRIALFFFFLQGLSFGVSEKSAAQGLTPEALWDAITGPSQAGNTPLEIGNGGTRSASLSTGGSSPRLLELDPRTVRGSSSVVLSASEINAVNNMTAGSPEQLAAKQGHINRLIEIAERDSSKGVRSTTVQALERVGLKAGTPEFNRFKAETAQMTVRNPGNAVAGQVRARGVYSTRGGGVLSKLPKFGLVDVLLQGAAFYKEFNDGEALKEIQNHLDENTCPPEVTEDFAKQFVLIEVEDQKKILNKCHEADKSLPKGILSQTEKVRKFSLDNFSQGPPKCEVRNGVPVIETLSSAGTQQRILFDSEGNFKSLQIFPQPSSGGRVSKFQGSFIEYFPNDLVSYKAITPRDLKNNRGRLISGPSPMDVFELKTPLPDPQSKNENLNSFAGRVICSQGPTGCSLPLSRDQFAMVDTSQVGGLAASVKEPFGRITPNKEFLINGAKALSQFRIGLKESPGLDQNFRNFCLKLGKIPPKIEPAKDPQTPIPTPTGKNNPKGIQ